MKIGGNLSNENKIWPLELRSNFFFPMNFRSYSIDSHTISIFNFSSHTILTPQKPIISLFNVTLENNVAPGKVTIFLNYLGFNIPVFFLIYDGKLEVVYRENGAREKTREKCDEVCSLITIDFEIFSNEEHRIKSFNLTNPNPTPVKVKLTSCNSTSLTIDIPSYQNEKKENIVLRRPFKNSDDFEICQFCSLEIRILVRNEKSIKETFFLEFLSTHPKGSDKFRIFGVYETINGSFVIPSSSNIRFNPGFPGVVQSKLVSIKSSFGIDCKVLEIQSADPRIIPYIIKGVIPANSKEEFMKVVFDPSAVQRENNVNFDFAII